LPNANERGNTLTFRGIDDLGTIHFDRGRLQQILVNLLSNACKFTDHGQITLTAARSETALTLSIADTGRGMKPEERAQLFMKFKKLAAREGNKTGTGLGLVICKGLCSLMGGTIECDSTFGQGTTFTVRLPLENTEPPPTPSAPAPFEAAAGTPLILVIDDDPAVRSLMTRFLEKEGYRTATAATAEDGIDTAQRLQPSLITLDVVLPQRDGWAALTSLKTNPETQSIPVVMLTFIEEKGHGLALGASDYILKPVQWTDLSTRIRRLLHTGPAPGDEDHTAVVSYTKEPLAPPS
jgi:CheY-like chemotaxis protein